MRRLVAGVALAAAACSSRGESTAPPSRIETRAAELRADEIVLRGVVRGEVRLPTSAERPFRIASERGEITVAARLVGARAVAASIDGARVVYEGALGEGTSAWHRATKNGTEDFVSFDARPSTESIAYALDVARVAGLRLVEGTDTLELLDEGGAPRLRVAPPFVADARGERHPAHLEVAGCAVDRDPRPPWGRAPIAPGAASCTLVVSWALDARAYPATVDPGWQTTGTTAAPRVGHTATLLADGRVLVIGGGADPSSPSDGVEIFDPTTGTFATAQPVKIARTAHTATRVADGRVVVIGGAGTLTPPETYDPTSGTTTVGPTPGVNRFEHASILLDDGRVLSCGGKLGNPYGAADSTCELFDPKTGGVSAGPTMPHGHAAGALVKLLDGRIFAVGGDWVDVLGASTFTWAALAPLPVPRTGLTATVLPDGRVVIAGGTDGANAQATVDVFDPAGNSGSGAWSSVPMKHAREAHRAAIVGGKLLVVGGDDGHADLLQPGKRIVGAEIFDPATSTWSDAAPLAYPRSFFSLTDLGAGDLLAVGGDDVATLGQSTAERCTGAGCATPCMQDADCPSGTTCDGGACTGPKALGSTCTADAGCSSGHCAHGVCCASACDGACVTCNAIEKGSGTSGTCGAIATGTDPWSDCKPDGTTCGKTGFCDGLGSCAYASVATACGPAFCDGATLLQPTCDGAGTCGGSTPYESCAPYACANGACTKTCDDTVACADGATCQSGHCVLPNGAPVSDPKFCASGNAADGVCCDVACNGPCETCIAGGHVGTCTTLPKNAAPTHAGCGGGLCAGTCDGQVGEACLFPNVGKACGGASCPGITLASYSVCTPAGTCAPSSTPTDCAPYRCTTGGCGTACASPYECAPGATCTNGKCIGPSGPKGSAVPCGSDADCAGGFCSGGICCNTACDGPCVSCRASENVAGQDGVCSAARAGTDPGDRCKPGAGACGATGTCDGLGSCGFAPPGTTCGGGTCTDGTFTPNTCDGLGSCAPSAVPQSCAPFRCAGDACASSCASDGDCADGATCNAGRCAFGPGAACSDGSVCASGFCVDDVCCDSPCDGACETCNAAGSEGTCTPRPAGYAPSSCGSGPCAGTCDGSSSACVFPPAGTSCGAATCIDPATADPGRACDGNGTCVSGGGPVACGSTPCKEGKCACASDADCIGSQTCDAATKTCTNPTDGGCGCHVGRGETDHAGLAALVTALAMLLRRRRRDRTG